MTMTAEQTTRIEKMEAELHEQRQIFIQGKTLTVRVRSYSGIHQSGFFRKFLGDTNSGRVL